MIFFAALNVNAKTISKDGYTYSIEGYKAEIYRVNYLEATTNPNYFDNNQPVATVNLDLDTYTNPTIVATSTADVIPTHFINLGTNEQAVTAGIRALATSAMQGGMSDSSAYVARLIVTYKVTSYPSTLNSAYKMRSLYYENEGEVKLNNISTTNQEQVVGLITLGNNDTVPGTTYTINDFLGGFAGNWQTMYNSATPNDGDFPNFIYMFHNFQIDQPLMASQLDEIYEDATNGNNNGSNNGNNGESGTTNDGNNGANGSNGSNGNNGIDGNPTTSTEAPTNGGDTHAVNVDDTAMSMPLALYIGSTILLLGGALVISKTMQLEDKQND